MNTIYSIGINNFYTVLLKNLLFNFINTNNLFTIFILFDIYYVLTAIHAAVRI